MSASMVRATVRAVSKRKILATRAALTLTPSAVSKIRVLLQDKPEYIGLKVGVRTRGCNGLTYTLDYTKDRDKSDEEVLQDGVRVFIEKKAQLTLLGTEMDFVESKLSNLQRTENITSARRFTERRRELCCRGKQAPHRNIVTRDDDCGLGLRVLMQRLGSSQGTGPTGVGRRLAGPHFLWPHHAGRPGRELAGHPRGHQTPADEDRHQLLHSKPGDDRHLVPGLLCALHCHTVPSAQLDLWRVHVPTGELPSAGDCSGHMYHPVSDECGPLLRDGLSPAVVAAPHPPHGSGRVCLYLDRRPVAVDARCRVPASGGGILVRSSDVLQRGLPLGPPPESLHHLQLLGRLPAAAAHHHRLLRVHAQAHGPNQRESHRQWLPTSGSGRASSSGAGASLPDGRRDGGALPHLLGPHPGLHPPAGFRPPQLRSVQAEDLGPLHVLLQLLRQPPGLRLHGQQLQEGLQARFPRRLSVALPGESRGGQHGSGGREGHPSPGGQRGGRDALSFI
uniref:Iron-sulfur cluster assembly 1 homolog, mitochondrial n=1 Tax=Scophthalmus maximus TaxID=52904 RepID=A0A8D3AD41_SCOMX